MPQRPFQEWTTISHVCCAAHQVQSNASIITQFSGYSQSERQKNRTAIKSLIHCTHILAWNHIAHTSNFDRLLDLVVSSGGESLKTFLETAAVKAQYTMAVVEFSMLWNVFSLFSKVSRGSAESPDLVELKTLKPSDTHWLTHKKCVYNTYCLPQRVSRSPPTSNIIPYSTYKMALLSVLYILVDAQFILAGANTGVQAMKASYSAIVTCLHHIIHWLPWTWSFKLDLFTRNQLS